MSAEDDYLRSDLPSSAAPEPPDDDYDFRRDRRRDYDLTRQNIQDKEHLRVLSILYYVFGGLLALGGFFPLFYVAMGVVFLSGNAPPGAPPGQVAFMSWFFIAFGAGLSLLAWTLAGCCLFTGYNLSHTNRYAFCFVTACLCCIQILPVPLGTILGIFTIIVLARPSVKELFASVAAGKPSTSEE